MPYVIPKLKPRKSLLEQVRWLVEFGDTDEAINLLNERTSK